LYNGWTGQVTWGHGVCGLGTAGLVNITGKLHVLHVIHVNFVVFYAFAESKIEAQTSSAKTVAKVGSDCLCGATPLAIPSQLFIGRVRTEIADYQTATSSSGYLLMS